MGCECRISTTPAGALFRPARGGLRPAFCSIEPENAYMGEQPSQKIMRLADGRWEGIFNYLAPELMGAMAKAPQHVRCPIHGSSGSNDGFRLFGDWRKSGGGVCNSCGGHADGISLIAWLKGLPYSDTLRLLNETLEGSVASIPPPRQRSAAEIEEERKAQLEEDRKRVSHVRRVWREAIDLDDRRAEPARLYFARRGLPLYRNPQVLRFHPGLDYIENKKIVGQYPALVFRVSDACGRSVTLHRIYLDRDGNKAPVANPKKLMAYPKGIRRLTGGAIRLAPAGYYLGVAEGPETALAVMAATGMPVWSTVSASLMCEAVLPEQAHRVTAWLDRDANDAGRLAGQALCQRLWAEGRHVGAVMPRLPIDPGVKSVDWLDVWSRLGRAGFPSCYTDPNSDYRRRA